MDDNFEQHLEKLRSELTTEDQLNRLKEAMRNYQGSDKLESSKEIEKRLKEGEPRPVHNTGISSLDSLLRGGFRGGQMVVIAAITKHGKTEFCIHLTRTMNQLHPLWFSYEDGAEELVERFMDRKHEVPLFYTPAELRGKDVKWIEERIVESIVKYDTKLIFIDNINYMVPRGENQGAHIGVITKALKDLATKWDVTIVLVAQLKKTQLDRHPNLDDIKDSSSIAQDASTVIFIWRQTAIADNGEVTITENVNVSVQAARRGKPGNIKMTFDDGMFREFNWNADVENFNKDDF